MLLGVAVLIVMAGLSLEQWRRPTGRGLYWSRLAVAGAVAVSLGAAIAWATLGAIQPTFIRATAIAGFLGVLTGVLNLTAPVDPIKQRNGLWAGCVVLVVAADLIAADWGANPDITSQFYRSNATAQNQINAQTGRLWLPSTDENEIKFNRFLTVKSFTPLTSWDQWQAAMLPDANILANIPSANNFDPLLPARYVNWMNWIETQPQTIKSQLLALMDVGKIETAVKGTQAGVHFEQTQHPGKFTWAPCVRGAGNGDQAWQELIQTLKQNSSAEQPLRTVIVEGISDKIDNHCDDKEGGEVAKISENNNSAMIEVNAAREGWLVQADTWYPGWSVTVDGRAETLYRADYLFRAVRIPAGKHRVVISYQPGSFYWGAGITLCALLSLAVYLMGFSNCKNNWAR
jgi:hypothetical protein